MYEPGVSLSSRCLASSGKTKRIGDTKEMMCLNEYIISLTSRRPPKQRLLEVLHTCAVTAMCDKCLGGLPAPRKHPQCRKSLGNSLRKRSRMRRTQTVHEKSCFNNDPLTAFAADQLAPSDCLLVGSGAEEAESWFFHPLYLNRASFFMWLLVF